MDYGDRFQSVASLDSLGREEFSRSPSKLSGAGPFETVAYVRLVRSSSSIGNRFRIIAQHF